MQTIIFDFGNVIGFFDHWQALKRLACHTDMPPEEMYRLVIATDLEDVYESGQISSEDFVRQVRALCRLNCEETILTEIFADIFSVNDEVCDLIPRLKPHYRILLGSNTNELHARKYLKQFERILQHFDALVLSYEIGVRKPQAGFFQHCHKLAACPVDECLFIDDIEANVAGAKACGLQAVHYLPGNNLADKLQALGIVIGPSP